MFQLTSRAAVAAAEASPATEALVPHVGESRSGVEPRINPVTPAVQSAARGAEDATHGPVAEILDGEGASLYDAPMADVIPINGEQHGSSVGTIATPQQALAPLDTFWETVSAAGGVVRGETNVDQATTTNGQEIGGVEEEPTYKLLGRHLVDESHLSEAQLKEALAIQAKTCERLGEILVRKGWVSMEVVETAVEQQRGLRSLENILRMHCLKVNHIRSVLTRVNVRGESLQQVMRDTRYLSEEKVALTLAALYGRQHFADGRVNESKFAELILRGATVDTYDGFVPVAIIDDDTIAIAVEDPSKENDAHNHSKFSAWKKRVWLIASAHTLNKIYCNYFAETEGKLMEALQRAEDLVKKTGDGEGAEGFMRSLVGIILKHASYSGASDIHLQRSPVIGTLAMRYDGVLRDVAYYDTALHTRLMTMLQMDGLEGGNEGDIASAVMREGKITFARDKTAQAEFADILQRYGYRLELGTDHAKYQTAVIRIIDTQGATADLDNLDFEAESRATIDAAISAPDGLILLVGPTGSGKTTTLYACLGEIDAEESSIQTTENPVEGNHGKWKQYQPNNRSSEGAEMGAIFVGMMRNDPDVILVGEIRDSGVADTAIQASKTGHLVFSTLHVDRAATTITRLLGLKVERQDIADTLKLVVAQRLTRRLCTQCSIVDSRDSTRALLAGPLQTYLQHIKHPKFRRAKDGGCPHCRFTGYRGRAMVYETLKVNRTIRRLIESGASTTAIEAAAIAPGKSMWDVGLRYVATGITSVEELFRNVPQDEGSA
jgi:general secretion pathway protein E